MNDVINLDLKKDYVRKQACFSQLTEEEVSELAALFSECRFSAGDTVVTEGDPVDSVFLIVNGTADVRLSSVKDDKIVTHSVATMGTGNAIGLNDTGFYSLSGKRTATVVAITDITTLRMNLAEFHGFSLANHHVHEVMYQLEEAAIQTKS